MPPLDLNDLALTDAKTRSVGQGRRQSLLLREGPALAHSAGRAGPIVALILWLASKRAIQMDQQDATAAAEHFSDLVSDPALRDLSDPNAQQKLSQEAFAISQLTRLDVNDVVSIFSSLRKMGREAQEQEPISRFSSKDQVDALIEGLPEGASLKADVDSAALGIEGLTTPIRISYTKKPPVEDDLAALGARTTSTGQPTKTATASPKSKSDVRARAVTELQNAGFPTTEANIKEAIRQLSNSQ